MPKKNAFMMYMQSRRPSFIAAGQTLAGGFRELAELCSEDWAALSEAEKNKFAEEAKLYNQQANTKNGSNQSSQDKTPSEAGAKNGENIGAVMNLPTLGTHRDIIHDIFKMDKWMKQPVVICSFSLYVEFNHLNLLFLPAEIGLTAMNLTDGVIDNFARIIDPGAVPKGYGIEAIQAAEKLGLPELGKFKDFSNHGTLMMIVESFLQKYNGNLNQSELHVFAFESDHLMVTRCFEWLFDKTNMRLPIRVLSLEYFAYLASTKATRVTRPGNSKYQRGGFASMEGAVSSYRKSGHSLAGNFIYHKAVPTCIYGVFLDEQEVEKVVKDVDNFKYYDELCCIYHTKNGKEIQNCALNVSNRYAFSILEILTLSLEVPIIPGGHYPEFGKPMMEKNRRMYMLRKWGITATEMEMEEVQHDDAIDESNERDDRFRFRREGRHGDSGRNRGDSEVSRRGGGREEVGRRGGGREEVSRRVYSREEASRRGYSREEVGRRGAYRDQDAREESGDRSGGGEERSPRKSIISGDGDRVGRARGERQGRDRRHVPGSSIRRVVFACPDDTTNDATVTAEIDMGENYQGNNRGEIHPYRGAVPMFVLLSKTAS